MVGEIIGWFDMELPYINLAFNVLKLLEEISDYVCISMSVSATWAISGTT